MGKKNFFSSIVVLVFFICFYALSVQLNEAGYWPKLICVLGAFFSVLNAVISLVQMHREENKAPFFPLNGAQLKRSLTVIAVVVIWLAIVPVAGYLVSSLAATGVLVVLFEPQKDKKHLIFDVIITVLFSLAIYGLFSALKVHFPESLLFNM